MVDPTYATLCHRVAGQGSIVNRFYLLVDLLSYLEADSRLYTRSIYMRRRSNTRDTIV